MGALRKNKTFNVCNAAGVETLRGFLKKRPFTHVRESIDRRGLPLVCLSLEVPGKPLREDAGLIFVRDWSLVNEVLRIANAKKQKVSP